MRDMFFHPEEYKTWRKGVLSEFDAHAREEAGEMPLFMTEWNSMAVFASPAHGEKYSAAFAVKTILDSAHLSDGYLFWCVSDIYGEQFMLSKPFHGGFGLINNEGIPKPNFGRSNCSLSCIPSALIFRRCRAMLNMLPLPTAGMCRYLCMRRIWTILGMKNRMSQYPSICRLQW